MTTTCPSFQNKENLKRIIFTHTHATTMHKPILALILVLCTTTTFAQKKLKVIVDERMELMNVVQYLAGYPILAQGEFSYKQEVDSYFAPYKNHNAVKLYAHIYERYFHFDGPSIYLYHHSFPGFKKIAEFSADDARDYQFNTYADSLALLMKEMKDFYKASNFHQFYTAHQPFYNNLIKTATDKIAGADTIITLMEKYYGKQNKEYIIVLAPLEHDGGYGPMVSSKEGNTVYAIIGPMQDSKGVPEFDVDHLLSDYVLHEFSHSFCNPAILKHWPQLEQDSCLLRPIRKALKAQGYGTWMACVTEHFVRTNEILLNEAVYGKAKADEIQKSMMEEDKWIYLQDLVPLMRQYRDNRNRYKTIDDIALRAAQYFHAKAKECK
jgi:hypothetical protein